MDRRAIGALIFWTKRTLCSCVYWYQCWPLSYHWETCELQEVWDADSDSHCTFGVSMLSSIMLCSCFWIKLKKRWSWINQSRGPLRCFTNDSEWYWNLSLIQLSTNTLGKATWRRRRFRLSKIRILTWKLIMWINPAVWKSSQRLNSEWSSGWPDVKQWKGKALKI